jgi:uncharacterized protein (DUF433 family)
MSAPDLIEHRSSAGRSSPVIKGTRVRVAEIAQLYRLLSEEVVAERIQKALPHLTMEQIQAALAYWRNHPDEVQSEIETDEAFLSDLAGRE